MVDRRGTGAPVRWGAGAGPAGLVMLVEGFGVLVCDPGGDVAPDGVQGLYLRDVRALSRWELTVNGSRPEHLATALRGPFAARHLGRARTADGTGHLLVLRDRTVDSGLTEVVTVTNHGDDPAYCHIEVVVDADLADVGQPAERTGVPDATVSVRNGVIVFELTHRRLLRRTRVDGGPGGRAAPGRVTYETIVPPRGSWTARLAVRADVAEVPLVWSDAPAPERHRRWVASLPGVRTDHPGLAAALDASVDWLGALRIADPDHPGRHLLAAAAPWSLTLVARDALLAGWMSLLLDPEVALGAVETLARLQGTGEDPLTEEEPGRIIDQVRLGALPTWSLREARRSWAAVDTTPLFVMLIGELRRWGLASEVTDRLMGPVDRAVEWIRRRIAAAPDGFIGYLRSSDRSPRHQSWRTSPDAIVGPDGSPPRFPVAPAEVQAYAHAALIARAHFAQERGEASLADRLREEAAGLRRRFHERFWVEELGCFASAVDGDGRPVPALTSAVGHCLWAGIVDPDAAPLVAEALVSDRMFTGFGVRTLSADHRAFDPLHPHRGAVWVHDTALCAAGLMRYGQTAAAHRIIAGQLDAAAAVGGRTPPWFAGIDRDTFSVPAADPAAGAVRAWAAAAPLLWIRTLLRLDPWVPAGRLSVAPALPDGLRYLLVERIPLLGARVTVEVNDGVVKVEGLPGNLEVDASPRPPVSAR